MKIIRVEEPGGGSLRRVETGDGETISLYGGLLADYHIETGQTVPDSAWAEILKENEFRRARERALYLLEARDYSYLELFAKLEQNYQEETCYSVCDAMARLHLLDDRLYAEKLARQYLEGKRWGEYRARMEMRRRGLSDELIDAALEPYFENTRERLAELVERKYSRYLEGPKGVQKVRSALARQGYSYEDIRAVLNEYSAQENEDWE